MRAAKELDELSIVKLQIVVNGVIPEEASNHPFFASRRRMQLRAIDGLVQEFNVKPIQVPLLENEVKGIKALRALGKWVSDDVYAVR